MPRDTKCDHRNCYGGPCKQLTDEELTPQAEDLELAKQLVAEGWIQVSAKYRMLLRWREPPPTIEQLVAPEWRGSCFEKQLKQYTNLFVGEHAMRMAPDHMTEQRVLTVRQFKAFKRAQR